MPKPKNIVPSHYLNVAIPLPTFTKLVMHLNSDLEGRVPHGAFSKFLTELLEGFFTEAHVDLSAYDPGLPPDLYILRGPSEAIRVLERKLA